MQRKLLAFAILAVAHPAWTQASETSSVEVYGVLDVTVGRVENSLSADPNYGNTINALAPTRNTIDTPVAAMINGGIQASRWGLRGNENLGNGLKAFFVLESDFNIQNGALSNSAASLAANSPKAVSVSSNSSLDGQLFGRQANVGLSSTSLGTISFGRNYNPIYDIVATYDPVQQAHTFSPLGASNTIGGGGGVSETARLDDSIRYKINFGPVNVGALYKVGGVAGNSSAESGYALNIGYEDGPFGIQGVIEQFTDVLKAGTSTVAGDINITNYNTSATFLAAKYSFGRATIKGGYESFTLKRPSDALASLGITNLYGYAIGNATSASANFSSANQTTAVWFIGGDYFLTPRLNLSAGFYDQNPQASSDGKQLDGNVYSYAALLDYFFSKRTDVYAGWLYSSFKGAQYPATAYNTSNYVAGFGIRTKF